jgi:tetratricopeptide (TPR) repeat protein
MIKHHAFFEILGSLEEKTPEWNSVFAGLSVLRLVDRFAELRDPAAELIEHEIERSRKCVESMGEGDPSRAILVRIINSLEGDAGPSTIGPDLILYGRSLDLKAMWSLAADVFQSVSEAYSARVYPQLVIEASTLLGAAARNTGDWTTSERGYARAEHLAESTGDRTGVLTVHIGLANSDMVRGNLQAADAELAAVIAESESAGLELVRARALHARASVAHLKGDYQRAIHLAYRSLELTTNQSSRDRLLADIAAAYAGLGLRETARNGYSIVAITSPHQWVRWQATLNLMELAIDDGDERLFDTYVEQMKSAALDPRLKTYFLFFQAMGAQRFGRGNELDLFETARKFAEVNKLHQIAFEIEAAMSKPVPERSVEQNDELMRIAEVIEHLREAASG